MRVINTPVFYIPYIVTPSPLRRKIWISYSIHIFNFFDTKTSQSTAFPYYFNLAQDKELTFTPILKYGGGVILLKDFYLIIIKLYLVVIFLQI